MKSARLFLGILLGLGAASTTVRAQDLGDTVTEPGLFTYQAPLDWAVKDSPIYKYKVSFAAPKNNFAANIHIIIEKYPYPLAVFVQGSKNELQKTPMLENIQIIDEEPFETASGLEGTRLLVKDTLSKLDMQQIFYFFNGPDNTKYIVTSSCLIGDGDDLASVFDASAKTFALPDPDSSN